MEHQARELSIGRTIKGSFGSLIDDLGFYIGSGILFWIFIALLASISLIVGFIIAGAYEGSRKELIVGIAVSVPSSVVAAMFMIAWANCSLIFFKGGKIKFSDFNIFNTKVLKSLILFIAIYSVVLIPFVLLLVGINESIFAILAILFGLLGIYLGARFGFSMLAILENPRMGISESLRYSSKITKNFSTRVHVIAITIVMDLLASMVVSLTFGLGMIVYFAFRSIVATNIYLELKEMKTQN